MRFLVACVPSLKRVLALAGISILVACGGGEGLQKFPLNLTFGPVSYDPAPVQMIPLEFGVNDVVAELVSGTLPLTITRTLTNSSTEDMPGPAVIEMNVVAWTFQFVGNTAGYREGPAATHTVFSCSEAVSPLASGESVDVSFTLGGPECSGTLSALPPGMYRATFTSPDPYFLDNDVYSFFFVQDATQILIDIEKNPQGDPDTIVDGKWVIIQEHLMVPPKTAKTVVTHDVFITVTLPSTGFVVNGRTNVRAALTQDLGFFLDTLPSRTADPLPYATTIDVSEPPLPCTAHPAGNPFSNLHFANVSTKITVISNTGTKIRQEVLNVLVSHECQP